MGSSLVSKKRQAVLPMGLDMLQQCGTNKEVDRRKRLPQMIIQMFCHNKWLMAFPCYSTGICEAIARKDDCQVAGQLIEHRIKNSANRHEQAAMAYRVSRTAFLGHLSPPCGQLCRTRLKDAAKRMAKVPIQLAESIGASPPEILRGGY